MDWRVNSNIVTWNKHFWYSQCIPKHTFILLLTIQNKLMTQDKLLKWNVGVVFKCALCDEINDSREHLFYSC